MKISTKKIIELLEKYDFTSNEARIYTTLLYSKPLNGSEISKELNIEKSSVYRALRKLHRLGLVTSSGGNYDKEYSVDNVRKLEKLISERKRQVLEDSKIIDNLITNLPAFTAGEYKRSNIKVYKGEEAFFTLYEDRAKEKIPLIREFSSQTVQRFSYDIPDKKYWDKVIKQRKRKDIFLHMLVDKSDKDTQHHRTSKAQFKEVRLTPDDFIVTSGINIYGDKVSIHNNSGFDFFGIIIEDENIAKTMATFFDFVWRRSKKI